MSVDREALLRGSRRRLRALAAARPRTANQLRGWLAAALGIETSVDEHGRDGEPFRYLLHAYFDGCPPGGAGGAAGAGGEEGGGADCVVWACRGGGKTFYAATATLLDLVFKPGIDVRVVGGSLEQSQRMHGHLRRLLERPAVAWLTGGAGPRLGVTARRAVLANGSTAEVCAQSETSVRGVRPHKMRCDEVELFDPAVWAAAQLCPRSGRCGGRWVRAGVEALSTMHRPHGLMAAATARAAAGGCALFRWGVADALEHCGPARDCARCELWEECGGRAKRVIRGGHVSIDDALAMKRRCGERAWRAEMLCERPTAEDLVLPEFSRDTHVLPPEVSLPPELPQPAERLTASDARGGAGAGGGGVWVGGMDFGFADPTVFLLAWLDDEGVMRVVDEASMRETVLSRVIERVRELCAARGVGPGGPAWIGADPAGHQRSAQSGVSTVTALRRAGLRVRTRRMAGGVEEGLAAVRARLAPATGGPTLFVHPRCAGLIRAMEMYRYERAGAGGVGGGAGGRPAKDGPDHWVDALRYLVINARPAAPEVRWYV